jgi:lysophospholipase L1-like esterase
VTDAAPEPRSSLLKTALAGVTVALLVLGVAEGALRAFGLGHPVRPRIMLRLLDTDVTLPYVREDLQLFWSPLPGFRGTFLGTKVSINALGLRGPEVPQGRTDGRPRIACFGDSITFGYGVSDDESYPSQLGPLLGAEVVNAGVTGYSSFQAVGLAKRVLPEVRPDVALLLVGWNDGNHRPVDDREWARRVGEAARTEALAEHLYLYRALRNLYVRALVRGLSRAKGTPKNRRVTPEQYSQNLEAFVEECRLSGARPALVALPRRRRAGEPPPEEAYRGALAETAARLQVPLLGVGDLAPDDPRGNDRFFLDALHLTPEGNARLAALLASEIRAERLLR